MAAVGYTPIQLYRTATAAASPSAANLTNGELAINYYTSDMAIYAKNSAGAVKRIMNNPAGLKYPTADGTNGQIIQTDGAGNLSFASQGSGPTGPTGAIGPTGPTGASGPSTITVGSTTIGNGSTSRLLYDNSATVSETTGLTTNGVTLTLAGATNALASIITNAAETTTVNLTAASGTINYDVTTQSVLFYKLNATGSWTINFRASSGASLDSIMSNNQSLTVAFLAQQGTTAWVNSAIQIDGSSVIPNWQGGVAPSTGNASSIDVYTYTIIKTASATFTVLASQTQFK